MIEGLEAGGQLMLTTLVENWPGFRDGIMGPELMAEMRAQAERFGAEIIRGHVTVGRPAARIRSPSVADDAVHHSRTLIIATGASARLLGLPSERALIGHGVSTCATCDGYFFRGKPIAVVGGGDSAMEEAIFLTRFASHVTVVHRRDTLRASKIMQDKAFANPKISFEWNTEVEEINDVGKRRSHRDGASQHRRRATRKELPVDGVFVAIGHTPNTRSSRGQLEMDANGYIDDALRHAHERAGRVRVRRRAGSHLPSGDHRRRLGLHGRDRRREVSRRRAATPRRETQADGLIRPGASPPRRAPSARHQSIQPPPTTTIPVVEDDRLARRDRDLRLVEDDRDARIARTDPAWRQPRGGGGGSAP